jgi:creatinine amidohydrolase
MMRAVLVSFVLLAACAMGPPPPSIDAPEVAARPHESPDLGSVPPAPKGTRLAELTWIEAEAVLRPETIVVIPLGAAAKEHGPHLLLQNDWIIAEYYADRVFQAADVVIAPTVGYHHYPAFAEYPGSTSLSEDTARALIVDICRSLSRFGPRRFYVLNTGISTVKPLEASAQVLAREGVVLRFTDITRIGGPIEAEIAEQEGGTHADEIETSMMLYIAPETVDMSAAVKDWAPKVKPGFSRTPEGPGHYSRTGIWGDPTLATREKGERYVEEMVRGILADLEDLRRAKPPRVR